jgi:hypothetical protein
MIVTALAILFLVLLTLAAYGGYRVLGRATRAPGEAATEKCSVCRERFPVSELVVRQIGDYKLMHFCKKCILSLYQDLGLRN